MWLFKKVPRKHVPPPSCTCDCARCDTGEHCCLKAKGCEYPTWSDVYSGSKRNDREKP